MWKKLVEAFIAVVVEESVRKFIPPFLPVAWLVILWLLTWELLKLGIVKGALDDFYQSLGKKARVVALISLLPIGVGISIGYWFAINKAIAAVEKKNPPPIGDDKPSRLVGRVTVLRFETEWVRFYQHPPVYFHPINTELFLTVTNELGKPLYVQNYLVAVLVNGKWDTFQNLPALGMEADEIGFLNPTTISRVDLSLDGFDFLMRKSSLADNQELGAFMFFVSDLSKEQQNEIEKIRFSFMDSTQEWHIFYCDPPDIHGGSNVVGVLKALPAEPRPPNLRQEP